MKRAHRGVRLQASSRLRVPVTLVAVISRGRGPVARRAPRSARRRRQPCDGAGERARGREIADGELDTELARAATVSLLARTRQRTGSPSRARRCARRPPMKPLAPVTRQSSPRAGSTGRPRPGWLIASPTLARGVAAQRRRGDVADDGQVLARRRPRSRARTASSAPRKLCASASESVSGGSSLITSFLPAAIVIMPWSRCSGITTSCGNRPSLAMWIRRQFRRAPRRERVRRSSIPIISPRPRTSS